jgi:hypothetical protein
MCGLRAVTGRPARNKNIPPSTRSLLTFPIDPSLIRVLDAFVELQATRHQADYDLAQVWPRLEAEDYVRLARAAFADWARIRATPNAAVFLTALLRRRHWGR